MYVIKLEMPHSQKLPKGVTQIQFMYMGGLLIKAVLRDEYQYV